MEYSDFPSDFYEGYFAAQSCCVGSIKVRKKKWKLGVIREG